MRGHPCRRGHLVRLRRTAARSSYPRPMAPPIFPFCRMSRAVDRPDRDGRIRSALPEWPRSPEAADRAQGAACKAHRENRHFSSARASRSTAARCSSTPARSGSRARRKLPSRFPGPRCFPEQFLTVCNPGQGAQKPPFYWGFNGDPGMTRTCDLRFRKPSLYPAELRDRRTRQDDAGAWRFHSRADG
jgi:hypothetical protein